MTAAPATRIRTAPKANKCCSSVIGGMLAASGIAMFFSPVTFYVVERLGSRKHPSAQPPKPAAEPPPHVTPAPASVLQW